MTKKTKWPEWNEDESFIPVSATEEAKAEMIDVSTHSDKPESVFIPGVKKPLYLPAMWAGTVPTFRCETCGSCEPVKDDIILHVLTHVPERDRDALLEKLTKEK